MGETVDTQQSTSYRLSVLFARRPLRLVNKTSMLLSVIFCSPYPAARKNHCQPNGNRGFSVPGALQCNPLHLASKVVGKAFPLDSLKRANPHSFSCLYPSRNPVRPCPPATTKTTARPVSQSVCPAVLLLFFAVLSLTPASFR